MCHYGGCMALCNTQLAAPTGPTDLSDDFPDYPIFPMLTLGKINITFNGNFPILFPTWTPIIAPAVDATLRKSIWIPSEISPHEIQVELSNPFLNTNGDVVEFSLLVTTDRDDSRNWAANQPSWKDSNDQSPMPPYFAVNRCTDLFNGDNMCWLTSRKKRNLVEPGTRVHFSVGGALNCDNRDDSFCNGPLQADSTYHVAIVGYTENGLHTVGPISDPIRTARSAVHAGTTIMPDDSNQANQPKSVNIVAIAVGVGLGVLLLISVLTSLVIFHCRKRATGPDEESDTRPQEDKAVGSDPSYTSVTSPDTGYEALDVENSNNQRNDYELLEGIYQEIPDATDNKKD
ncbi:hypothetical protein CAPTEDRAFT_208438 [Capitella teleta]|uniref:PTPRJ transmembrane domain-containing protein n=1 Tax=Capitella teleta TaxID=283909 RepID=R7TT81_CAPTE|nr:hypothetical protein CAPTEDRAFT_208438 [Capitella teleta]|eukprot:ELT97113.1 hypothetical protein CAPTEDRAFT_208438 [Capitella teleta]